MKAFKPCICVLAILFSYKNSSASCRIGPVSCVKATVVSIDEFKTAKKNRFYTVDLKVKTFEGHSENLKHYFKKNYVIRVIVRGDKIEGLKLTKGKQSSLLVHSMCNDLGGYPFEKDTPELEVSETCSL